MSDEATPDPVLSALRAAAERTWGPERARTLDASLRRMAVALETVDRCSAPASVEPFPAGPEAKRG
jgi:hypothetical protein